MAGNGIPSAADVIVVGSGSAGAVVARRLVDAGAQVVLLEAGGADLNPAIHDPGRLFELWDSEQDWGYQTVPQAACAGRELHWPRGKVLGGSSALNGMIYARGHRCDFDTWAYLGNDGWGYDDVLPLFRRSEDFDRGASAYHGAGGPLHVLSRYEPHPLIAASPRRPRKPACRSTTTTTASGSTASRCASSTSRTASATAPPRVPAPVADAPEPHRADGRARAAAALRGRALHRRRVRARRCARADPRRGRGDRVRRHRRVAEAAPALGHRPGRRARPPRHRRRRRPARRRAQPPRPPALARHPRRLTRRARRRSPGCSRCTATSSGTAARACPAPTSSRSSSTCRSTSRAWRARPTATR